MNKLMMALLVLVALGGAGIRPIIGPHASTDAPNITASDYTVIPRQDISIDVLEHPVASNPFELVWVDSGFSVAQVISSTLIVNPDETSRNIPFAVPSDSQGTYYLETRKANSMFARSAAIEVLLPLTVYLPVIARTQTPDYICPTVSTNQYAGGRAFQVEGDNPVRPAYNHADKNIALRSYSPNADPNLKRELVDYGSGDPTQPPQLATIFSPHQVPRLSNFYQVNNWNWASSPSPGTRGDPITSPPITALGLETTPGQNLSVPLSGRDIGGGMQVIVLFADEDTVTLKYTREDTAATGYTVHVDNICTDPNLLALYQTLDDAAGPRYVFVESRPYGYDLPILPAGKPFGTARGMEIVVAIVDTGTIQDTRSCNEWWQIRPGYAGTCPSGP